MKSCKKFSGETQTAVNSEPSMAVVAR